MSVKIRWDIPTNHPKNCRCTPCLSVNVFDKKPPMTITIRESMSQKQAASIMRRAGFVAMGQHMDKASEAFKRVGEAVQTANERIRAHIATHPALEEANQDLTEDEMDRLQHRFLQRNSMSNMRGPS